jgi:LmbE family N-acetylglucosaminyl deacetylase
LASKRTILYSFAHPDDESFLVAGVSCRYGTDSNLVLATATLGEEGKVGDPPICSYEDLPRVREAELRSALAILGIGQLHLLGYRDKALAAAPHREICEKLVRLIRSCRPAIVITFDPNGANLHDDHIAISRFTSDAVAAAADPRWSPAQGEAHQVQRLLWTPPLLAWEVGRCRDFLHEPGIDFLVDTRPWLQKKAAALKEHRTQHLSIDRVFFSKADAEQLLSFEAFRQGFGPPLRQRPSEDLFEGVE